VSGPNQRIRGWEQELIIGAVIILLALLKVMFDVRLTREVLLALAGVVVVLLVVVLLARRASPAFDARLEGWRGDRRVWYGGLAVVIAMAVLALSIRVEGLESTVSGLESTAAGDSAELEGARATEAAMAAEAAALRASLAEQEKETREVEAPTTQPTRTAQPPPTDAPSEPTDVPDLDPTPTSEHSAADGVGLYWERVGQGEYRAAWDMLSPGYQSDGFAQGFEQYQQGIRDWLETLCHVEVARAKGGRVAEEDSALVDVIMVYQIKPDCATVTHAFEYQLKRATNGAWLIDEVTQID
jgi:hypothetical protein